MTIIITASRLAYRVLAGCVSSTASALRTHIKTVRWRRRILRSLAQRRRD